MLWFDVDQPHLIPWGVDIELELRVASARFNMACGAVGVQPGLGALVEWLCFVVGVGQPFQSRGMERQHRGGFGSSLVGLLTFNGVFGCWHLSGPIHAQ